MNIILIDEISSKNKRLRRQFIQLRRDLSLEKERRGAKVIKCEINLICIGKEI